MMHMRITFYIKTPPIKYESICKIAILAQPPEIDGITFEQSVYRIIPVSSVLCSYRAYTHTHTGTQIKYCNPRCACVPRVNILSWRCPCEVCQFTRPFLLNPKYIVESSHVHVCVYAHSLCDWAGTRYRKGHS